MRRRLRPPQWVRDAALDQGWVEVVPEGVGDEEATRQADLPRLVRLAEGRGVTILSYHLAKGLEFEAVFLPRLEEGELPYRAKSAAALAEERRLLYVGITRAKRHLHVSWVRGLKPSRLLEELGVESSSTTARWPRSPTGRRQRSKSSPGSPAWGRQSSTAVGPRCWRRSALCTDAAKGGLSSRPRGLSSRPR